MKSEKLIKMYGFVIKKIIKLGIIRNLKASFRCHLSINQLRILTSNSSKIINKIKINTGINNMLDPIANPRKIEINNK